MLHERFVAPGGARPKAVIVASISYLVVGEDSPFAEVWLAETPQSQDSAEVYKYHVLSKPSALWRLEEALFEEKAFAGHLRTPEDAEHLLTNLKCGAHHPVLRACVPRNQPIRVTIKVLGEFGTESSSEFRP